MNTGESFLTPVYWLSWLSLFAVSKAKGAFAFIMNIVPDVQISDIKYLPSLQELLPAVILAAICAIVSFLIKELAAHIFNKIKRK